MLRNLTLLTLQSLLGLLLFMLLPACNNPDPKPGQNQVEPNRAAKPFSDTLFAKAFERLTAVDSFDFLLPNYEIGNENTVKFVTDSFYSYASKKLRIDTSSGSKPRLNLGVTFKGAGLKDWIIKMDTSGAVSIKIKFGIYNNSFLENIRLSSGQPEYDTRDGRLMLILVAYNAQDQFVGAYNLGGMEP